MTMPTDNTLNRLLVWLALYVLLLIGIAVYSGKALEVIPVLTHLISGFSGAAFAIMRSDKDKAGKDQGDE